MAVTSEEAANLRFDIGRRLYQLGLDLDEPRLLQSAASHLGQAQDLYARRNQVEKQLPSLMLQGRALLAVAEYRQAAAVFTYAEQVGRADAGSEASLYLGIAEVRSGNVDKGAQALTGSSTAALRAARFLGTTVVVVVAAGARCVKRAILIGIDRPGERIRKDDVAMVKKVLLSRCSLAEADIIELGDKKHKEDVAAVFETLKQKSKQEDALLISSGAIPPRGLWSWTT